MSIPARFLHQTRRGGWRPPGAIGRRDSASGINIQAAFAALNGARRSPSTWYGLRGGVLLLLLLLVFLLPCSRMGAAVITYEATDLADPAPGGGDLWRYTYRISDFVFSQGQGFSIFFSPGLYRNLQDPPPAPNADWDLISLQPDIALNSSGIFDGQALINGASLNDPFTVEFIWLGTGTPGSQLFDIHDANFVPLIQGTTSVVPEPAAGTLILWTLAAAAAAAWLKR